MICSCLGMEMLKSKTCFWKGKSSVADTEMASEMQTHSDGHLLGGSGFRTPKLRLMAWMKGHGDDIVKSLFCFTEAFNVAEYFER